MKLRKCNGHSLRILHFYLILNMGLGGDREGSWAGPIDDANLPAIMEVDWVKVSKLDK